MGIEPVWHTSFLLDTPEQNFNISAHLPTKQKTTVQGTYSIYASLIALPRMLGLFLITN
jgi:hypothetical protein